MTRLLVASVLGVGGLLADAGTADAQFHVVGTGGTPSASLGYYSPVPGTLYSPFIQAQPVVPTGSFFNSRFAGPTFIAPNFATGGFTVTRFGGPVYAPHHRGWGGHRR